MTINHKLLKQFQKQALHSLSGEWVLIGGTVLHLLGLDERLTMDIDLARKSGDVDETLELMNIAEKLKLPLTAINQAGAFFLKQIPGWENKLVLWAESPSCRLYRPNGDLYLQLKMARMSESDLQDCLQMIKYCQKQNEKLDQKLLQKEIQKALKKATSPGVIERLQKLASSF